MRQRKPKAAPPAFQFYVKDFMTGTMTMSLAEVGAYIRLMCHQWNARSVPGDDLTELARAMVCDRTEAESVWPKVRTKFRQKNDGNWTNSRLEKERRKQARYRKLQSQKGKRSAKKRTAVEPRLNRSANRKSTLQFASADLKEIPPTPRVCGGPTRRELSKAARILEEFQHAEQQRRRDSAGGAVPRLAGSIRQQVEALAEYGLTLDDLYQPKSCMHAPACTDRDDCLLLIVADRRRHEAELLEKAAAVKKPIAKAGVG
jgi:uncharacterized protein YdaU (DUF1376 family)